jgi:hypothetical protein
VKHPRFASASLKEQRGAKKKIDSYRLRMRQSNFINGTHNRCVSVMSMVDTEVCRSLVEQMLLPGCTYDVTNEIQMGCVADFYEMKENTTGVTDEILVKEFETRVKMIHMNMRTPSSFERL